MPRLRACKIAAPRAKLLERHVARGQMLLRGRVGRRDVNQALERGRYLQKEDVERIAQIIARRSQR